MPIKKSNLPDRKVSVVAINSDYNKSCELTKFEIKTLKIKRCEELPSAVACHADMNLCYAGDCNIFITRAQCYLEKPLNDLGFKIYYISENLSDKYPMDVKLNCAFLGNKVIMNSKTVSVDILNYCNAKKIKIISVKQGYTKCSVFIVNENAIITSDEDIANKCKEEAIDVLKITPGHIDINSYNYGFIGGCGGLIDKNKALFSGDITRHPDFELIHNFLAKHSVEYLCLSGKLTDIGGIIPLL